MTNTKTQMSTVSATFGLTRLLSDPSTGAASTTAQTKMTGQIVVRPAEINNPNLFMVVGMLEGSSILIPERLYRAFGTDTSGKMQFMLSPGNPADTLDYPEDLKGLELGSLVTQRMWSLFECEGPSLQIYLRKSTHPGEKPVFIFSGVLRQSESDPLIVSEVMHDLSLDLTNGAMSVSLSGNEQRDAFVGCRGYALSQMLKVPVWGTDAEPYGFRSVMEHDYSLLADELRILTYRKHFSHLPDLTEEEEARREEIDNMRDLAWLCGSRNSNSKDKKFMKVLKHLTKKHGIYTGMGFRGIFTAAQKDQESAWFQKAFDKVMTAA